MKIALGIIIAAQLLSAPASTFDITAYEEPQIEVSYEEEGPNRQEQFMWFYRMHEGHEQKRLWSVTYAYWVTDWIDCY